jgi:hypothetical protein
VPRSHVAAFLSFRSAWVRRYPGTAQVKVTVTQQERPRKMARAQRKQLTCTPRPAVFQHLLSLCKTPSFTKHLSHCTLHAPRSQSALNHTATSSTCSSPSALTRCRTNTCAHSAVSFSRRVHYGEVGGCGASLSHQSCTRAVLDNSLTGSLVSYMDSGALGWLMRGASAANSFSGWPCKRHVDEC